MFTIMLFINTRNEQKAKAHFKFQVAKPGEKAFEENADIPSVQTLLHTTTNILSGPCLPIFSLLVVSKLGGETLKSFEFPSVSTYSRGKTEEKRNKGKKYRKEEKKRKPTAPLLYLVSDDSCLFKLP